jgi:hypothetical protein
MRLTQCTPQSSSEFPLGLSTRILGQVQTLPPTESAFMLSFPFATVGTRGESALDIAGNLLLQ